MSNLQALSLQNGRPCGSPKEQSLVLQTTSVSVEMTKLPFLLIRKNFFGRRSDAEAGRNLVLVEFLIRIKSFWSPSGQTPVRRFAGGDLPAEKI